MDARDAEQIHEASLALLDDPGVRFEHEGVRRLLLSRGGREVGIAGSFLEHEHTLRHFRSELFMPRLLLRERREKWQADGARDLAQRAEEVAAELAARPVDNGLTPDQAGELDRIASRFLSGRGGSASGPRF